MESSLNTLVIPTNNITGRKTLKSITTSPSVEEHLSEESDISNSDKLLNLILSDKNTINKLADYCKSINSKFEEMKIHINYYLQMERTLNEIKDMVSKDNINLKIFKCNLYNEIKTNIEKGYANTDMIKFVNSLNNSAVIVKLIKHIQNIPKSKNLQELGSSKLSKILPFKEFELKKLIKQKIIISVLHAKDPNYK